MAVQTKYHHKFSHLAPSQNNSKETQKSEWKKNISFYSREPYPIQATNLEVKQIKLLKCLE